MARKGLRGQRLEYISVTSCFDPFVFELISINDDVMAAILVLKTVALSRPQFSSDFLQILYVISLAFY